jgi:acyl-CoA hydrolase
MDMTSVTLTESGITQSIHGSGLRAVVKETLARLTDAKEKRRLGAAPDYAIGSVHAVTEDGQVVIASNTGSQLPAYAYGADHVIWVVGAQKIVQDLEEALQRVYEHALPLEADRARKAYGAAGSNVSKLLVVSKEVTPNRIHIVFIKELVGF